MIHVLTIGRGRESQELKKLPNKYRTNQKSFQSMKTLRIFFVRWSQLEARKPGRPKTSESFGKRNRNNENIEKI